MFLSIEELAVIYNKILTGTATPDDLAGFQMTIKTSRMNREVLYRSIEEKAAELRRQKKQISNY